MFTALTLAAVTLAAPVPRDEKPAGPPPRVLRLTPDGNGRVWVSAVRTVNQTQIMMTARIGANGQAVQERIEKQIPVRQLAQVELADVKDLTAFSGDGKEVAKADALKRLADGGVVVVSADGKPVDASYLKLFRDDVLVLVSPELGAAGEASVGFAPGVIRVGGVIRPGIVRPLPQAIPAQAIPVQEAPAPVPPKDTNQ